MYNQGILATLGTQDTGRREKKKNKTKEKQKHQAKKKKYTTQYNIEN